MTTQLRFVAEKRLVQDFEWGCPECGGCSDDQCGGGCWQRWCGGHYMREGCDRCPAKVAKEGCPGAKKGQVVMVRCNGKTGHEGSHHWLPDKVGE